MSMVSPVSQSSQESSDHSEWFRQSVLFWSSQSDEMNHMEQPIDDIDSDKYLDETTLTENKIKTNMSRKITQVTIRNTSQKTQETSELNEISQKYVEKTTNICKTSTTKTNVGKENIETVDKDNLHHNTNIIKECQNRNKFDPSELLRQVEELERCFLQTSNSLTPSQIHHNNTKSSTPPYSPHLTLDFPDGSSIKSNPLYVQAEHIYNEEKNKHDMSRRSSLEQTDKMLQNKNKSLEDYHNTSFDDLGILLGIAETAVMNDKRESLHQQNSTQSSTTEIQELQNGNTGQQLSSSIDIKEIKGFSIEETEGLMELIDCIEQSTPRLKLSEDLDDKKQSLILNDTTQNFPMVTNSDTKSPHNKNSDLQVINESNTLDKHNKEMDLMISTNGKDNKSQGEKKNNKTINETNNIVEETDNHLSTDGKLLNTFKENDEQLHGNSPLLTAHDCAIDKSVTDTEVHLNGTDSRIIDSIQKVQDTLYEISREIQYSVKARNSRDPNIVLQTLLSGIKPPPETDSNDIKFSKNLSLETPIIEEEIQENYIESDMATSHDYYNTALQSNDELFQESKKFQLKSEELLKQIDSLLIIENEEDEEEDKIKISKLLYNKPFKPIKPKRLNKNNDKTIDDKLERKDSGLHSTSSDQDSNSPYPSPNAKRQSPANIDEELKENMDSLYLNKGSLQEPLFKRHETIFESLKEYDDVFNNHHHHHDNDSDFSSDWSPISTLESVASSTRTRSNSLPRSCGYHSLSYTKEIKTDNQFYNKANMSDSNILKNTKMYNDNELKAIRKFLTLTNRCLEIDTTVNPLQSLEELSIIPSIKASIENQRQELQEQREKQEEFLHQIGDLLLEVVTLKEEHTTVRTKQAKALTLLKKQLDLMKKHQSKAHKDVLSQVNILNDRLNSSLSDNPSNIPSPLNSPTFVTPRRSFSTSSTSTTSFKNHGQIIWKVSDIMKKLTRMKSGLMDSALVSNSFQTSEYGYKMNTWLYLNGRGKTIGKYISLYVCVLVGEYDAILPWPIRPSYKFTLIDQKNDLSKRCDYIRVRNVFDIADKGANVISQNGGIPRPSDSTKALIVGFDDFITHEQLLERRYLADDVLFIKIEADVSYE